jgi:pimeloyl-ACP methyl ester carboxylesterase
MATFVLVHGTTAGGWVWRRIAQRLQEAGHTVYRPTLTGLGERVHLATREVGLATHIQDVVNVIHYEDLSDVILVGHSYGGIVVDGVAEAIPERTREIVYLDAVIAADGESVADSAGPETRAILGKQVMEQGDGWLIPLQRGPNDLPGKNTPHPWKSWTDPLKRRSPAAAAIPRIYLRCTADKQTGSYWHQTMETSWQRAQANGWRLVEIDTMHQISPDPESKAAALLALYAPGR